MDYRYEISADDLGEFRNTTLGQKFEVLDPDGFVTDEKTGDRILESHGWIAEKTVVCVMNEQNQMKNEMNTGKFYACKLRVTEGFEGPNGYESREGVASDLVVRDASAPMVEDDGNGFKQEWEPISIVLPKAEAEEFAHQWGRA